jgi:hypothetical protein
LVLAAAASCGTSHSAVLDPEDIKSIYLVEAALKSS